MFYFLEMLFLHFIKKIFFIFFSETKNICDGRLMTHSTFSGQKRVKDIIREYNGPLNVPVTKVSL